MKIKPWKRFFFESNQFFEYIEDMSGWKRLRAAYPDHDDDQLLSANEATYQGNRSQEERDANPNYGFRYEHDGERTLRDFFQANGMELEPGYYAKAFKGKSRSATGNQMPPGIKNKAALTDPSHISLFSGQAYESAARRCNKVRVIEVWMCEKDGDKDRKLRKLSEHDGPTAERCAAEFIANWREDAPEQQPPMCPADGKNIKPDLSEEVQPCLKL